MTDENQQQEDSTEGNTESAQEAPSSGGGLGAKIFGWGIVIAIGLGIGAMRGDKKQKWFEQQHELTKMWCAGDAPCLSVVESRWKDCLETNYDSHRQGKYNRKYDLDEASYR